LQKLLDGVETVGNKVPHPAVIFFILIALVILLSHLLHWLGTTVTYEAVNPETHKVEETTAAVNSLLTADGIRFMLTSMVRNFANFGPVGIILVVMIGVGLGEQAGLINALIKKIVIVSGLVPTTSYGPTRSSPGFPANVGISSSSRADGWRAVLEPVIVRYRGIVKRLYFRGDAAFASPEIYRFLEAEGMGDVIWLPANRTLQDRIGYLLKRPGGRPPHECAATSRASAIRRRAGGSRGVSWPRSSGTPASFTRVSASSSPT
jgi:hypothetical protein